MKKLRWLKEWQDRKVGDISNAGEKSASNFVSQGFAEYVEETPLTYSPSKTYHVGKDNIAIPIEEKARKELARYLSDVATLENNHVDLATEQDLQLLNVLPDNYLKWYKEKKLLEKITPIEVVEDEDNIRQAILRLFGKQSFGKASEVMVDYIESKHSIYTTREDKASEIWIYEDGVYIPNGRSIIKEIIRIIMQEYSSSMFQNQVINKIENDTYINSEDFFNNNYVYEIPVQNGILNVLTKELVKFTPKKIFFNKLPVTYVPESKCPMIDKFLTDVLASPDDKKVFYEIAGFGLIKEYIFEKSIMMVGDGRNGKGKSLELLKRLVGAKNCCSLNLSSLKPDSFALSELFGRLFNLAGDLSSTDLKDTGVFKSLTGRDIISASRKFLKNIYFTNYAKMVFACNELPKVYDSSMGFWERWILLEFPYRFVEKEVYKEAEDKSLLKIRDENIIDKITTEEELSGFLNEALVGLERILKNRRFSYSKGTEEIKNTWIRKSDSFKAFCLDNIEEEVESKIMKKEIRRAYSKYCKKHKLRGVSDKSIKITLEEQYGVSEGYVNMFGNQEHCWEGIKWT